MQLRVRRSRRLAVATALALALLGRDPALGAGGSPGAATAQLIIVSVPAARSTTGTLTAYERVGPDWRTVLGPTPAVVGELGVGAPADDVFRTPVGTFPLDQAFGRRPNPGTKMPYFQTSDQDWWDEDPDSPTYNLHTHGASSPSSDAENPTTRVRSTTTRSTSRSTRSACRGTRPGSSCMSAMVTPPGDAWRSASTRCARCCGGSTRRRRRTSPSAWGHSTAMTCPYCGGEVGDTGICPRCGPRTAPR